MKMEIITSESSKKAHFMVQEMRSLTKGTLDEF